MQPPDPAGGRGNGFATTDALAKIHGPILLINGGEFANVAWNWLQYIFKGDREVRKMFVSARLP